ncbi:MAG: FISUMP domain-containing protein [Candidatus Falkowbacteria bacterium]
MFNPITNLKLKFSQKVDKTNATGFTLIELLVVIVIIGTLAALTMIGLNGSRGKARDVKRVTDVRAIMSALDLYFSNEGLYPSLVTVNQPMAGPSGTTYMSKVPANPHPDTDGNCTAGNEYSYLQTGNGTGYLLSYCLGNQVNTTVAGSMCALPGNAAALPGNIGILPGNAGANKQPECSPCVCGDCSTLSCGSTDFASTTASCTVGNTTYYAVKEGTQCWLDKNINIGTALAAGADMTDDTIIKKWCYNGTESYCTSDGALYTWSQAMYLPSICDTNFDTSHNCAPSNYVTGSGASAHRQGLCPKGWHVPSDYEFSILENYLDSYVNGTNYPDYPNYYADSDPNNSYSGAGWRGTASTGGVCDQLKPDNTSCSDGLAAGSNNANCGRSNLSINMSGYRFYSGGFNNQGNSGRANVWASTQYSATYGWSRVLYQNKNQSWRTSVFKTSGFGLRCIKD